MIGAAAVAGIAAAAATEVLGPTDSALAAGPYQFPFSPSTIPSAGYFGDQTPGVHNTPHRGLDFAPGLNAPIPAVADGTVVRVGSTTALGYILTINHHDGYYSGYAHMIAPASVSVGQVVSRGTIIGRVGNTGRTTGPHLHLTIGTSASNPDQGAVVDPLAFIRARETDSPPNPTNPTPALGGDRMIRIQSPGRGIALIGAGYYRHLATSEEVEQSGGIVEKHLNGNDRQFDLWVSMALGGVAAKPQQ